MNQRGHLKLLPAPEDRAEAGAANGARGREPLPEVEVVASPSTRASKPPTKGRRLAPGAPLSPSALPLELATELRVGEVAVWWNEKSAIAGPPVLWMLAAALLMVGVATAVSPDLWRQPLAELWKPILVPLLPALLVLAREWASRRAIAVTDGSVLSLDHRGRIERLGFRNVRRVRRDLVTGGVLLEGAEHTIRIPPVLADDAREAIASQTRMGIRGSDGPDDALGWMP